MKTWAKPWAREGWLTWSYHWHLWIIHCVPAHMHEAHFLTHCETALQMAPCHLCWEVPWTHILQQCHKGKACLGQLLSLQREKGPLSACCTSRVATTEASTTSISHGLWHCLSFLDTRFPAENTSKIPQKQQRVTGKLVLYLEPKATASGMDQPHPKCCPVSKDWGNRRMLGSPMEISNQPLFVHKSLLFPPSISKLDFKSLE